MLRGSLILLALVGASAAQAQVLRCESADGKVTYANGGCPPGTSLRREVPSAPAVSETERKRAEGQAKADAARVKKLEQTERAEAEKRERARVAEAKKAQERERNCRNLALKLQQAEDHVATTTVNKRDAAERSRDRAREQYAVQCKS